MRGAANRPGAGATALSASDQRPVRQSDLAVAVRFAMADGPVLPMLMRLALPMIGVLLMQSLVGIAETFYASRLSTDTLVGVSVFFPIWMLISMMSAGGMGGGVASAVARAIGAGRLDDADDLVLHAIALGAMLGLLFMAAIWLLGPAVFRILGCRDGALEQAVVYSRWLSLSAMPMWIVNLASAALRGAGNVKAPALVALMGALVLAPLSPLLIFGLGPLHSMGMAGSGLAATIYYSGATLVLLRYLQTPRAGLKLVIRRLRLPLLRDILGVGLVSSLAVLQINLTIIIITGTVGRFGAAALAGYGIGVRLEYLLTPTLFGVGSAMLTLTGIAIGAGNMRRARSVAFIGTMIGACFAGSIGLVVATAPRLWLGIFNSEAAVLREGSTYLGIAGFAYPAMAAAFLLAFVSQGAGRPMWTTVAGTMRLIISAGAGWLAVSRFNASLQTLSIIIASGHVAAATLSIWATRYGHIWPRPNPPTILGA